MVFASLTEALRIELAGVLRLERRLAVLETDILPLDDTPSFGPACRQAGTVVLPLNDAPILLKKALQADFSKMS